MTEPERCPLCRSSDPDIYVECPSCHRTCNHKWHEGHPAPTEVRPSEPMTFEPGDPEYVNYGSEAPAPAEGAPLTPYGEALLQRISDYRSGYSCGYSDAKNGTRMRDKDAASLFFGPEASGIPDVSEYQLDQGSTPAEGAEPFSKLTLELMEFCRDEASAKAVIHRLVAKGLLEIAPDWSIVGAASLREQLAQLTNRNRTLAIDLMSAEDALIQTRKQNERLREALRKLAKGNRAPDVLAIAREALAGKEESK